MSNFTLNRRTSQALNHSQSKIYHKILANQNTIKAKRKFLTRKDLVNTVFYAIGTVSNALQALKNKGLIYFDRINRVWRLVLAQCTKYDNYDNYIMFKWDMAHVIPWRLKNE